MNDKIIREDSFIVSMTKAQLRSLMEEVLSQSSPPTASKLPELLDVVSLAKLLKCKGSTIYALVHERKIPFYRFPYSGRKLFFKTAEIYQWLSRVDTNEEAFENFQKEGFKQLHNSRKAKQTEIEFIRQNLREAKTFLKLLQFIQSLLIKANANHETGRND